MRNPACPDDDSLLITTFDIPPTYTDACALPSPHLTKLKIVHLASGHIVALAEAQRHRTMYTAPGCAEARRLFWEV